MRAWQIWCVVLACLWLVGLIRMGGQVTFGEAGLTVRARLGPVRLTLFPPKKKKQGTGAQKPRRPKQKKPTAEPKEKAGAGDTLALLRHFLPLAAEAAGRFARKIRIDWIELDVIWGSADAAACAKGYGYANEAVGMLWPLLEHNFNIRRQRVRTAVDFQRTSPMARLDASLSLTIGQSVALALMLGWRALNIYFSYRRDKKENKAV